MGKKIYIWLVAVVLVVVVALVVNSRNGNGIPVTVYKSLSCGCCVGYVGELKGDGFNVEVVGMEDVQLIKDQYNIPSSMSSCHTSVVEGYFVEGHVPLEAVEKLLRERPDIDGIALPNMPSGAPGMPGPKRGDFVVYAIKDGQTSEFMRI